MISVTFYLKGDTPIVEPWPDDTPNWQLQLRAAYHGAEAFTPEVVEDQAPCGT